MAPQQRFDITPRRFGWPPIPGAGRPSAGLPHDLLLQQFGGDFILLDAPAQFFPLFPGPEFRFFQPAPRFAQRSHEPPLPHAGNRINALPQRFFDQPVAGAEPEAEQHHIHIQATLILQAQAAVFDPGPAVQANRESAEIVAVH